MMVRCSKRQIQRWGLVCLHLPFCLQLQVQLFFWISALLTNSNTRFTLYSWLLTYKGTSTKRQQTSIDFYTSPHTSPLPDAEYALLPNSLKTPTHPPMAVLLEAWFLIFLWSSNLPFQTLSSLTTPIIMLLHFYNKFIFQSTQSGYAFLILPLYYI